MAPTDRDLSLTSLAIEASVQESLRSGTWRSYHGPNLERLRAWTQSETGKSHVRFCSSGTLGIELALRALHLQRGDEIILCGYDFPGNFRGIDDAGGIVVLCDPNPQAHWQMTLERIEDCVSSSTRGIIISHLHGASSEMSEIVEFARRKNLVIIEDACQVHGGSISGKTMGGWGDIGVFSYGGSKLISAGRGGVIVTDNELFSQRMTAYAERGNDAFALSEIQATIILPQCERLQQDHALRSQRAKSLLQSLRCIEWLSIPEMKEDVSSAYYKIGMLLGGTREKKIDRDLIVSTLQSYGVAVGAGFKGFAGRSPKRYRTPHALVQTRVLSENAMVLHHSHLLDPQTGEETIDLVLDGFRKVEEKYLT